MPLADGSPLATTPLGGTASVRPFERIPDAQWTTFEESSHLPHVEEPDAFPARVEQFLETSD